MDDVKIAKRLLQIIFEEAGNKGVSVNDIENITQEMIRRVKGSRMVIADEPAEKK